MGTKKAAPEASVLRLSRYHCYVGDLLRSEPGARITSQSIAAELGVSEETVRRDLSYIDAEGRPGAGYEPETLYDGLARFLDLSANHPFIAIGNASMLSGLTTVFPADDFGLTAVGYFSDRLGDAGVIVDGIEVYALEDVVRLAPKLEAKIALVAVEPGNVDRTLELLVLAGVKGALMLTPVLHTKHPEGLNVTYFRIPCTLKSLVVAELAPDETPKSCCGN